MGKRGQRKGKREKRTEEEHISEAESAGELGSDYSGERKIWIVIAAVLFIVGVVSIIYAANARREMINFEDNLINCAMELEEKENQLNDNQSRINILEQDLEAASLGAIGKAQLSEKYVNLYKEWGLKNPAQNIISDLIKHNELIPYSGTQGRAMRFYNRRQIYVISPNKVFANFGDQIISGWMLLQYRVKDGGDISWKVLDSYCAHYDE